LEGDEGGHHVDEHAGTDRARLLARRSSSSSSAAVAAGVIALLGWAATILIYVQTPSDEQIGTAVVLFGACAIVAAMACVAAAAVSYVLRSLAESEPIP
jgi:hypothetical protein